MPVLELLSPSDAGLPAQVPRWSQIESNAGAAAITVTASPFTYQNTSNGPGCVIVSGGTVTTISYSRDGSAFFLCGLLSGMYHLSAGDFLRVVYVLAPTMTFVPF